MKRVWKYYQPDGVDIDGPYWYLPNDRKTYDFNEWLRKSIRKQSKPIKGTRKMKIFKKPWGKVVDFVIKTQTDRLTGEIFLTAVLAIAVLGGICCLGWLACMVMEGMPVGWLIFDGAVVAFCAWAVIKGIIPMAKEAFGMLEKLDYKEKEEQHGQE